MSSSSIGRTENKGRRRLFSLISHRILFPRGLKKTPTQPTCLPRGGRMEGTYPLGGLGRQHSGRPGLSLSPLFFTYKYRGDEGKKKEKKTKRGGTSGSRTKGEKERDERTQERRELREEKGVKGKEKEKKQRRERKRKEKLHRPPQSTPVTMQQQHRRRQQHRLDATSGNLLLPRFVSSCSAPPCICMQNVNNSRSVANGEEAGYYVCAQ